MFFARLYTDSESYSERELYFVYCTSIFSYNNILIYLRCIFLIEFFFIYMMFDKYYDDSSLISKLYIQKEFTSNLWHRSELWIKFKKLYVKLMVKTLDS